VSLDETLCKVPGDFTVSLDEVSLKMSCKVPGDFAVSLDEVSLKMSCKVPGDFTVSLDEALCKASGDFPTTLDEASGDFPTTLDEAPREVSGDFLTTLDEVSGEPMANLHSGTGEMYLYEIRGDSVVNLCSCVDDFSIDPGSVDVYLSDDERSNGCLSNPNETSGVRCLSGDSIFSEMVFIMGFDRCENERYPGFMIHR